MRRRTRLVFRARMISLFSIGLAAMSPVRFSFCPRESRQGRPHGTSGRCHDAHGKNFSILHDETGPRLAPLYDLLATVAYPELSPKLAMQIGRRASLGEMDARGWAAFAADTGLGLPLVRRRVVEISDNVKMQAEEVAGALMQPGLDAQVLSRLAETVIGRAQRCAPTVRV